MQTLRVDQLGVTRLLSDGVEHVRWDDLVEVKIVTTSDGPYTEDAFFVLIGASGGCVVPNAHVTESGLLKRLQELPGFENQKVIDAMASTDEAEFVCWRRTA